jgi:phosphoribosylcarboxyaminoimidazole (NCAIR) mutase
VISGAGRRADSPGICGRALTREEVIGTPLAQEAFSLVDALWLTEPRIEAIRQLDDMAHDRRR